MKAHLGMTGNNEEVVQGCAVGHNHQNWGSMSFSLCAGSSMVKTRRSSSVTRWNWPTFYAEENHEETKDGLSHRKRTATVGPDWQSRNLAGHNVELVHRCGMFASTHNWQNGSEKSMQRPCWSFKAFWLVVSVKMKTPEWWDQSHLHVTRSKTIASIGPVASQTLELDWRRADIQHLWLPRWLSSAGNSSLAAVMVGFSCDLC